MLRTAYNLKKYLRFTKRRAKSNVEAVTTSVQSFFASLILQKKRLDNVKC